MTGQYPKRVSDAEYQRAWRAKHGARTGHPGRIPTQPCGTVAAYRRHRKAGEQPCDACREAWNAKQRDSYRQRKGRA
jgi:hypothetical protein